MPVHISIEFRLGQGHYPQGWAGMSRRVRGGGGAGEQGAGGAVPTLDFI